MPHFHNPNLAGAGGQGGAYLIDQSLRFNTGEAQVLTATPGTAATTRTKGTISFWVKYCQITVNGPAFFYAGDTGTWQTIEGITAFNQLRTYSRTPTQDIVSSSSLEPYHRDFSGWKHVVCAYDTTQIGAGNRADQVQFYVNGVRSTGPAVGNTVGGNTSFFNNVTHYIGGNAFVPSGDTAAHYYLAEFHAVQGQVLLPTAFGKYDETTGAWVPIEYEGTYGTNGFYLKFDPGATNGLGEDYSGNGLHFTASGFTTSGTGTDVMSDTPTNNYPTGNPLASNNPSSVSEGNLKFVGDPANIAANGMHTTMGMSSGKWYFEVDINVGGGARTVGILPADAFAKSGKTTTTNYDTYYNDGALSYSGFSQKIEGHGASVTINTYGDTWTTNDVIGVAFDADNGKLFFAKNNTWQESGDPAAGTNAAFTGISGTYVAHAGGAQGFTATFNFGQRAFAYTPPTGFKALNTSNLPAPDIANGTNHVQSVVSPVGSQILSPRSLITEEPEALTNGYTLGGSFRTTTSFSSVFGNLVPANNISNWRIIGAAVDDPQGSGGNSPDTNYIEFDTPIPLSGTCIIYHGDAGGGTNPVNVGGSLRVTYSDGTSQTSTVPNGFTGISPGNKTLGNLTITNYSSHPLTLNNTKSIKRISIGNNMTGRFGSTLCALQINGSFVNFTNTIDVVVADASEFAVNDTVIRTGPGKGGLEVRGRVSAISGNTLSIETVDDWQVNWAGQSVIKFETGTVTNFGPFGNGLMWIKDRDNNTDSKFVDAVRGSTLMLQSPSTVSETAYTAPTGASAAWCWSAPTAWSNSAGTNGASIASSGTVNHDAGFSTVIYSGDTSNSTWRHGLNVAPNFVLITGRNNTSGWSVYHHSLGPTKRLQFNQDTGEETVSYFQNTAPTNQVFSVTTNGGVGASGTNYVAYCWAEVEGFSKFGTYTGNGNADGPFVYLGFRPGIVIWKRVPVASGYHWPIRDSTRDPVNPIRRTLYSSTPTAEQYFTTIDVDYTCNGFKLRSNWDYQNNSGVQYIYAAWAQNPFQNAPAY